MIELFSSDLKLLHNPGSACRIWNNGRILMFKVSKQLNWSFWYDRICKWCHCLPGGQKRKWNVDKIIIIQMLVLWCLNDHLDMIIFLRPNWAHLVWHVCMWQLSWILNCPNMSCLKGLSAQIQNFSLFPPFFLPGLLSPKWVGLVWQV